MNEAKALIRQTLQERTRLIELVSDLSDEQANYKPAPDVWSINEKIEHLVLAEVSGVSKIWSAAEGVRKGRPVWAGEHINRGLSIKEVIARTWRPKETAPPIATPHIGGPLAYWLESFATAHLVLDKLGLILEGLDLDAVLFPHFLCGPLDARQRLDFLRFHILRHRDQVIEIVQGLRFPA